jgi:high affinity sulfate transporter 1
MVASSPVPPPPRTGLYRFFPGMWVLRHYRRDWLWPDIGAGLVLTALLVPAGMGYAVAAGLPAITGLYATIFPLVAYALCGPSRILVLGPDSALAALIAATVAPLAAGDPDRAVALAAALAVLTGALCIIAGLARFGFLTDLLSRPVRVGSMNGIALTVMVSQLPKLCGFSAGGEGVPAAVAGFVRGALAGKVKLPALVIGAVCLGLILGLKARWPRVPGVLIAVVGATVAVSALGLDGQIAVVGEVPRGVPRPVVPLLAWADLGPLVTGAAGIALVAFADTSVLSRTFAARSGDRVDPNRELVGLGVANIAGGFFSGFPVSSSSSRTPVAEAAGARTQLTGVTGAVAITVLLAAAPGLVRSLPVTALAAIVIAAAIGLVDLQSPRLFARARASDFFLTVFCFLGVAVFGPITGIAMAVGVSLLDFIRRAWRPHEAILGRAPGVKGYHDITRYPTAKQVPGLLLYRWDAPLFFANADTFRARIIDMADSAAAPLKWVVVAAEPITDVDTTAAEMIEELDAELTSRGIELCFAEMKDPVKDRIRRYGLVARIGHELFFPTIGVAVKEFLDRHRVEWVDWEQAPESAAPPPSRDL